MATTSMTTAERSKAEANPPADPVRARRSLEHLYEILKEISLVADEKNSYRCPYKDRLNRCTAQFGCRNQRRPPNPGDLKLCGGDDKLDYRSAWDTEPSSAGE